MINKILVFGGLALFWILVVENMVVPRWAFVFIDQNSSTWMLSVVSTIVGVAIWFWLCNIIRWEDSQDEDLNF